MAIEIEERTKEFRTDFELLQSEISKIIVGHAEVIESVLIALFSGGHCLLEGVPGLGKTLLVRTLAQALAKFSSSVLSGSIHNMVIGAGGTSRAAYAAIFGIEAVGLLVVTGLLLHINVLAFKREVASLDEAMEYSLG